MESDEVRTFFETIDIDVWDAWAFFKLLDLDGGRGGWEFRNGYRVRNFCFQDLSGTQEVSRSIIDPEKWNSRKKRVETNHSTLHHFVENRNASLDTPPQKRSSQKTSSSNHHRRFDDDFLAKVVQLKLRIFCWAAYVYVERPDPWMSSSCFMTKPGTSRIKAVSGCSWRTNMVGFALNQTPCVFIWILNLREHHKSHGT